MTSLQLQHVSKSYRQEEVVRDFTSTIESGEYVVVTGPSNAGKSTLLKLIAGKELVSSGVIRMNGVATNRLGAKERTLPILNRIEPLAHFFSVQRYLTGSRSKEEAFAGERPHRFRKVKQLLELEEDLLKKRVGQLSSGERQRVMLAKLFMKESSIFIVDEPLTRVDLSQRLRIFRKIREWQRQQGITLIHATKNEQEVMLADRVMILNKGKIQQVGKPLEIYNRPSNIVVASWLGSPPMNLAAVIRNNRGWTTTDGRFFPMNTKTEKRKAILGIRPEHIQPAGDEVTFYAIIKRIEIFGAETVLTFPIGEDEWKARWTGEWPLSIGEKVGCHVLACHMTWFDEEGERLENPRQRLFDLLEFTH